MQRIHKACFYVATDLQSLLFDSKRVGSLLFVSPAAFGEALFHPQPKARISPPQRPCPSPTLVSLVAEGEALPPYRHPSSSLPREKHPQILFLEILFPNEPLRSLERPSSPRRVFLLIHLNKLPEDFLKAARLFQREIPAGASIF